jgi:hypothetical protein
VFDSDTQCLADPGTRVVEEQHQRVIATPGGGGLIRLGEKLFDLLRFQILRWSDLCTLVRKRQHTLVLTGSLQVVLDQMPKEATNR